MSKLLSFLSSIAGTTTHRSAPQKAEGLVLPVRGEWQVFWGGEKLSQNYHVETIAQRYALDLCISTDQKGYESYQNEGEFNEDYYCWSQPILAPFDGKVVISVDGIPDNTPGDTNEQMVYGNTVMIQRADGTVVVLAHLMCGSVLVSAEETVKAGQKVAECGNSGNSSEPHLHFHIQSEIGFEKGIGLLPIFDQITVNGDYRESHSPIKNEKIEGKTS